MTAKVELQRKLEEKLRRIRELKAHKPKKHCGHKEYSVGEDVAASVEMERLEEEVAELRAQIKNTR